ncbi:PTS sugar transporter subunit IIB [Maledivibacter halophilus]|uniref:PTS system, galactitol-specific IIB component n=1 Tax=Maledivibacter halophilus TaxID=36842 RepID=A0A1T5MI32_9FIRM|nr:hypothetical protein [Maledivibacter halophilus]SKC87906.1 PTS system, galactitol-specific IIB component [Maledivibacter halophilus]
MKKILVACGTSENKKKFAVNTIKDYCLKEGVNVEVEGKNVYEVNLEEEKPNVIVLIGPNKFKTDIPIVVGTAFITKLNMDEACKEILSYL